tara:strand:+ start:695 stop:1240 length:546 start_codon:yes stop_codon:yes gene_type:complete
MSNLGSSPYNVMDSATGTGSSNTITFSSIPQTYKSLVFLGQGSTTYNSNFYEPIMMTFNNDSAANYALKSTLSLAGVQYSYDSSAGNNMRMDSIGSNDASYWDTSGTTWWEVVIPNYTQSSGWHLYQGETGGIAYSTNHAFNGQNQGAYHPSTPAAITRVDFYLLNGNFSTATEVTMYGLR